MEGKIIKLQKYNSGSCLICGQRDATIKFSINRPKHDDNVTSFNICDECLIKMQKDIEKICE